MSSRQNSTRTTEINDIFPAAREHFHFCPRCGAAAAPQIKPKSFVCEGCDFVLYFNIACAYSGLIVNDNGHLLFVRRAKEPAKGLLGLPGGFADPEETAEEGLLREVFEEVGLRVAVTEYLCAYENLYAYRGTTYPTLDFFFVCRLTERMDDAALTLQESEIAGFEWRDPQGIRAEEIAFPSMRQAIALYRSRRVP